MSRGGGAVEVLLLDLAVPGLDDGYTVLEHWARYLPIVVVTGRRSAEEGGRAKGLGAVEVWDKPVGLGDEFVRSLFHKALRCRFERLAAGRPFLLKSVAHLFDANPIRVARWSTGLGVYETYHRREWAAAGLEARHVLRVYRLYRAAFEFLCCERHGGARPELRAELLALLDYLDTHRTEIMPLIRSRARVAPASALVPGTTHA